MSKSRPAATHRRRNRVPFRPRRLPGNQRLGGGDRDRTDDLLLAKQVLSQLSYAPRQTYVPPSGGGGWRLNGGPGKI